MDTPEHLAVEVLKHNLKQYEEMLKVARAAASQVTVLEGLVRSTKEAIARFEGEESGITLVPPSIKFSRMRLPEAIIAFLEEHPEPTNIQNELLPALLAGNAHTGKRKPEKPLRDNPNPLRPLMITIEGLSKNGRILWNRQDGTVSPPKW